MKEKRTRVYGNRLLRPLQKHSVLEQSTVRRYSLDVGTVDITDFFAVITKELGHRCHFSDVLACNCLMQKMNFIVRM